MTETYTIDKSILEAAAKVESSPSSFLILDLDESKKAVRIVSFENNVNSSHLADSIRSWLEKEDVNRYILVNTSASSAATGGKSNLLIYYSVSLFGSKLWMATLEKLRVETRIQNSPKWAYTALMDKTDLSTAWMAAKLQAGKK